jgi:hypothetical protein
MGLSPDVFDEEILTGLPARPRSGKPLLDDRQPDAR